MAFDHEDVIRHFGRIWPVHVEHFTRLLIELRRQFDGDLDLMLVLAVIGLRTLPGHRVEGLSYHEFRDGKSLKTPGPINVQSISDSSGIPRETVRRKVQRLEAEGWIERKDSGYITASPKARDDLSPATEATLRYLATVGSLFVELSGEKKL